MGSTDMPDWRDFLLAAARPGVSISEYALSS
jgi:hypothetical protein